MGTLRGFLPFDDAFLLLSADIWRWISANKIKTRGLETWLMQLRFELQACHPKPSDKLWAYFRELRWRSFYALQTTFSQISPFRIHGHGTWISFYTFLVLWKPVCQSLNDLVMASSNYNWNLGRKNGIYCILTFWCQPSVELQISRP